MYVEMNEKYLHGSSTFTSFSLVFSPPCCLVLEEEDDDDDKGFAYFRKKPSSAKGFISPR
jgi:hypothetical protein